MQALIDNDVRVRRLLQPLLALRHAHLQPLIAVRFSRAGIALHYGQPQPCDASCEGIRGALRLVHAAGLWVGNLLESIGLDDDGRVVLTGVGSNWDLADPFAGHPSATGYDLRVRWRQRGDEQQWNDVAGSLTRCA